jgi:hypothetical protein
MSPLDSGQMSHGHDSKEEKLCFRPLALSTFHYDKYNVNRQGRLIKYNDTRTDHYQLMRKKIALKGVLKFTLKQLQHVLV